MSTSRKPEDFSPMNELTSLAPMVASGIGEGETAAAIRNETFLPALRKQRVQDFVFHKITLFFALSVLLVLGGIIVSLIIGAWPAFKEFGPSFITTIDWDPVNDKYGALIAIAGTLITSTIALLIAFPVSFGIALFLTEICPAKL